MPPSRLGGVSKVDAMRALREARMSALAKAVTTAPARRPHVTPEVRTSTTVPPPDMSADAPEADVERCGHRNMGGRSCTRDTGHSEKNHRYI